MSTIVDSEDSGSSQIRDRAIRLFTYLKELCALRTIRTRDVASYDQVFWFSEIPHDRLCRCIAWQSSDPSLQATDQTPDVWIQIQKPTLKSPPELPDELEPWVNEN